MEWTVKFKGLKNSRLISILRMLKNNNENAVKFQLKYWRNLFINVTLKNLTPRQKRILLEIFTLSRKNNFTLTRFAKTISKRMNIPESTAKWNLRVLRDLGLIEAGNHQINRFPLRLTKAGLAVITALQRK